MLAVSTPQAVATISWDTGLVITTPQAVSTISLD